MFKLKRTFFVFIVIFFICGDHCPLSGMRLRLVQQQEFCFQDDYPVAMTTLNSNLVVALSSGAVKVFSPSWEVLKTLFTTATYIAQMQTVSAGILYTSQTGTHFLWQPRQDDLVGKFVSPEIPINVVIGLRSQEFAFGYQNGVIDIVNPPFKKVRLRLRWHDHGVTTLIQLDHNLLVSGSKDGKIVVWSLDNGYAGWKTEIFDKGVRLLIPARKENFVSVMSDGTIMFWYRHADIWLCKKTMKGDNSLGVGLPVIVAWPYLIAVTAKGTLKIFSLDPDEKSQEFLITKSNITALTSLGNGLFAIATADGIVKIFSLRRSDLV